MTSYTNIFAPGAILPTDRSYLKLTMGANITLAWPVEVSSGPYLAVSIIDVLATTTGLSIALPSALLASTGACVLFNNIGANPVTLTNNLGVSILTLQPTVAWFVYLTDNTTVGGQWSTTQFGAGIATVNASALAGFGLIAQGSLLSTAMPNNTQSSNFTLDIPNRASLVTLTGGSATFTTQLAATLGNNWYCGVKNSGSGVLTVATSGSDTIDGQANLTFSANDSAVIVCAGGTSFYTLGRTKSVSNSLTFLSIPISPTSGTMTLTSNQYGNGLIRFTGALSGSLNIVFPPTLTQWDLDNQVTLGAFTLTCSTAAGTQVTLNSGRTIIWGDGTNVLNANTSSNPSIIPISQGGTNATTAPTALTNLGGTSVGTNVFTALTAANARASLGSGSIGDPIFISSNAAGARATLLVDQRTAVNDQAYAQVVGDKLISYTNITAPRNVTLMAASAVNPGFILWVEDEGGNVTTTNTINILRAGSDTINGGTSFVINVAYGHVGLQSNGSNRWTVVNSAIFPSSITNGMLAQMAANTLKCNITGSLANPTDQTLTAIMDAEIGNVQGGLAYRNATVWALTGTGNNGQVLLSGGAGANPSWGPVPGQPADYQVFTANGTWTKPGLASANSMVVGLVWGGGAGGAGTAGGAGGGACRAFWYRASDLNATESVTVGATASGNSGGGTAGNASTFKGITANGGVAAQTGGSVPADSGSGSYGAAAGASALYGGGGGGSGGQAGGNSVYGGGGGGGNTGAGGTSVFGGAGGAGSSGGGGFAGSAPGGGGGGGNGQAGGAGGRGEVRIWTFA